MSEPALNNIQNVIRVKRTFVSKVSWKETENEEQETKFEY
jgi:hypothetical protein